MTVSDKLDRIEKNLKAMGADALRLDLVQRTRLFKRSWVEMAQALVYVRDSGQYSEWGYEDLYSYCSMELQLRRPTVDKLTGSYVALARHAPNVLERDGVSAQVPTCDAVDYFAKALRGEPANDGTPYVEPTPEVIEELKAAVFDEGRPVQSLRRQFNPLLHPKTDGRQRAEAIEKARAAIRRLTKVLGDVEGLGEEHTEAVGKLMQKVQAQLDELMEQAREDQEAEEGVAQAV